MSEVTALGVNVVPLGLWFFEDYAFETVVILYALESLAAIVLAVLCVLILAPAQERSPDSTRTLVRGEMIGNFLLAAGTGTLVIYVFVGTFIFLLGKGEGVELADIRFGLLCVSAFQLFEFISNLYLLRPLSLKKSELLLSASFGGIALLILSILIGVFLGAFSGVSVFLPFIVLKTIIDLAAPIQFFTGKSATPLAAQMSFKSRSRF